MRIVNSAGVRCQIPGSGLQRSFLPDMTQQRERQRSMQRLVPAVLVPRLQWERKMREKRVYCFLRENISSVSSI